MIHCFGGKSRSPAFIAAYVMSSYNWTFDEAYSLIKQIRPAADINHGFECQLRAYAAANYDVYIAQQLLLRTRVRDLYCLRQHSHQQLTTAPSSSSSSSGHHRVHIDTSSTTPTFPALRSPNPQIASFVEKSSLDNSLILKPKPVRSTSRHKRALSTSGLESQTTHSTSNQSLAELDTGSNYHSPVDRPAGGGNASISSGITDGSQSGNSYAQAQGFAIDNHFPHTFQQQTSNSNLSVGMDVETSTELEDSLATSGSHGRALKSPFNSKQTMTGSDMTSATTNSSFSTNMNSHTNTKVGFHFPTGDTHSLGSNSIASNHSSEMMEESHDSLQSFGSNMSVEPVVVLNLPDQMAHHRQRSKSHRTSDSISSSNLLSAALQVPSTITAGVAATTTSAMMVPISEDGSKTSSSNVANNAANSKYPACRLSRPGSTWVRVIPPLLGLEREFKCSWCNTSLFQLANVLRVDIENISLMLESFQQSLSLTASKQNFSNTVMRRDFDETLPPDELEEAFLSRGNSIGGSSNNAVDVGSKFVLPPITKKASAGGSAGFGFGGPSTSGKNKGFAQSFPPPENQKVNFSHTDFPSSSSSSAMDTPSYMVTEMDIDSTASTPSYPMIAPLKTSRAKQNKGFTFESNSADDNETSFRQPPNSAGSIGGSGNSNSNMLKETSFKRSNSASSQFLEKEPLSLLPLSSPMSIGGPTSYSSTNSMMSQSMSLPSMSRATSITSNSISHPISAMMSPADFPNKPMISPRLLPSIHHHNMTSPPGNSASNNSAGGSGSKTVLPPPQLYDDSPRVSIPPHRLQPENNLNNASRPSSATKAPLPSANSNVHLTRPKSAEKRRWLARLHLLRGEQHAPGVDHHFPSNLQKNAKNRVSHVAEADDSASQHYILESNEKYFHVEYMEWMGSEVLEVGKDFGDICCPGCKHVLGSWSWNPSPRLLRDGRLEAPLFRIHKHVVHHVSFLPSFHLFS